MAGGRILLIEDEADQVLMVRTRLEAAGFEVSCAPNGPEGLRRARLERPELVLLDLVVPGMEGLEICRRLTQAPETRQIPVVVFTASSTRDLEQACRDAGAAACMRKPYESSELIARVSALLPEQPARPGGERPGLG